ncbi:MAG TPA: hypothetical protein VGQ39_03040 [Pyrinomonadaceae bacterium]|jgi:hypothetical protein|nr:hypothetical protein [Pyrinomonadaceae bacterium]
MPKTYPRILALAMISTAGHVLMAPLQTDGNVIGHVILAPRAVHGYQTDRQTRARA